MKKGFYLLLLLGILSSCEKELHIKLKNEASKIVVQGSIDNGTQPFITLTESIGFFDKIDLNAVKFIKNATINITDITDQKSITLKEYTIDTLIGNKTFSFTIYGPDFTDPNAFNFKGIEKHIYKMQIDYQGNSFESYSQIAPVKGFDSIWLEPVSGKEDSFSNVRAFYTDPDTFGNTVYLETKVNHLVKDGSPENYYTSFTPVYSDDIVNGTKVKLNITLGYDKSKEITNQEIRTLGMTRKGDTVTIRWAGIDKGVFNFWNTLSFSAGSVGNPFATPVQVISNVKGALGVWGAYNSKYYTIIDSIK